MGTVFMIDIRHPGDWRQAVDGVVAWLHHVDALFSTYRSDSDVSRIRRGELRVPDAHPLVAEVLDLCARAQDATDGWFTAQRDGGVDPTGLVKGWAIERATDLLRDLGVTHCAVNGGGDMQLVGEAAPGRAWSVGIADPFDRRRVLTTVHGRDIAVATSGAAERGLHIVDPFTGRPADAVLAATVIGPSLTHADVLATAAVAMGEWATAWLDRLDDYDALLVMPDGDVRSTSGWRHRTRGPQPAPGDVPLTTATAVARN
jgi:thiamine biosynthesis lipoprotein